MSHSTEAGPETGDGHAGRETPADEFERLRQLILGLERDRVGSLERRLDDPDERAEELSHILPDSLARAARRDNRLGIALSTVLDEALAASIKKSRKDLAAALAPAMGPAIRRAIAETLRATVDSFNQVLQHSLSPRALQWRLEAWRTGRPFAEVVLSHSLVFRVEQVFLVHRKTGLLLQHVAADPSSAQDGDLVSGMLTAIQDFVRDSFSVDAEQGVDTMRVGDLAVWIEQGEEAYVAALIRGTPPTDLRRVLRDALDTIQFEFGDAFETFSGDSAGFEDARHHLEGCLQMQVTGRRERRYWLAPAVAAGIALLVLAVWFALSIGVGRRWGAYLARLRAEPGILVVSEKAGALRQSISGLADPYTSDPVKLLADSGLDAARVSSRWEPYVSQEPSVVLARVRALLQPPGSVTLALSDGTLSAIGTAPHRWAVSASARAATIPGVVTFDAARLVDEGLAAMSPIRGRLEAIVLRFDVGAAELPHREDASLDQAAVALKELAAVSRDTGIAVRIDVIGHTDGTGSEGTNVRLSRARAEWVLSALEAEGVRDLTFAILGVGASRLLRPEETADDRAYNRSVTFQVATQP